MFSPSRVKKFSKKVRIGNSYNGPLWSNYDLQRINKFGRPRPSAQNLNPTYWYINDPSYHKEFRRLMERERAPAPKPTMFAQTGSASLIERERAFAKSAKKAPSQSAKRQPPNTILENHQAKALEENLDPWISLLPKESNTTFSRALASLKKAASKKAKTPQRRWDAFIPKERKNSPAVNTFEGPWLSTLAKPASKKPASKNASMNATKLALKVFLRDTSKLIISRQTHMKNKKLAPSSSQIQLNLRWQHLLNKMGVKNTDVFNSNSRNRLINIYINSLSNTQVVNLRGKVTNGEFDHQYPKISAPVNNNKLNNLAHLFSKLSAT